MFAKATSPEPNSMTTATEIADCREHYGAYYLHINPGYTYVPYQQELIAPALEAIEAGSNGRLMVIIAAGESKTRLCTAGFAPWVLGRNPGREILILSYVEAIASNFGKIVRDQLNAQLHRQVFPWCKLSRTVAARNQFETTLGGKIWATSWKGAIAAIRADLIIIDDPLKSVEEAASDNLMQQRMELFNSVVKDRLKPGGRIIICTHRLAPRDFIGRILEQQSAHWKVLTLQSEPDPHSEQAKYLEPGTHYLWENYRGRRHYEEAKLDQWKWETTQQQRPERAAPERFDRRWLRVYTDRINKGRFDVWIIVDPALSTSRIADRTSIMALAAGPEERLFIVDWVLDRFLPDERCAAMIKMADRWEASAIVYEETGMQSDTFYLQRAIDAYGIDCPIIPVGRRGERHMWSKERRIAGLIPTFRDGKLVLPGRMTPFDRLPYDRQDQYLDMHEGDPPEEVPVAYFPYKQKDGKIIDLMQYFIEQEYVPWAGKNSIEHDEGLDTLSRIHDPEFQPQYPTDNRDLADDNDPIEPRPDGVGQFEGLITPQAGWFAKY